MNPEMTLEMTPEKGYAIVVARRNLNNAHKRLMRNKRRMEELAQMVKTAGGDFLPHVTRIAALHDEMGRARRAIWRWEGRLAGLGVDVHMEALNSINLKVD